MLRCERNWRLVSACKAPLGTMACRGCGGQALPVAVFVLAVKGALASLSGLCFKPSNFPEVSRHVAPRPFSLVCGTPSSAHFLMDARGVVYGGKDEDEITMDIISQGPVPWSVSRFNQGDFAPRLGPKWEASQSNLGVRAPAGGSSPDYPAAHCSQAWRPHRNFGIVLPTVAKNGQDWGDGLFFGTAAISSGVSGGYGYSMVDGSFGTGDCDVIVGKAGDQKEANIDVAVSWLPYSAGFYSGFVAAPVHGGPAEWSEPGSHSPLLPMEAFEVVQWHWGRADHLGGNYSVVRLPPYTAPDGMLFAAATDGGVRNNDLNIVSVRPTKDLVGWEVQVHEDFDPTRFKLAPMQQWMFCFLFIPYKGVKNLHAVHVDGLTGLPNRVVGNVEVQRVGKGRYWLRVLGKGPLDGVWLLQCAGQHKVTPGTLNAFLSYEWNEFARTFVVEVRHVSATAPPRDHSRPNFDSEQLHERFPQSDADFFALWMDHRDPPAMRRGHSGAAHLGEAPDSADSPFGRASDAELVGVGGDPVGAGGGPEDAVKRGADSLLGPPSPPLPGVGGKAREAVKRGAAALLGHNPSLAGGSDLPAGSHNRSFTSGFFAGVTATLCVVLVLQAVRGLHTRQPESRAIFGAPVPDEEGEEGLMGPL